MLDAPHKPAAERWRSARNTSYEFAHPYLSLRGHSQLRATAAAPGPSGDTAVTPFSPGGLKLLQTQLLCFQHALGSLWL